MHARRQEKSTIYLRTLKIKTNDRLTEKCFIYLSKTLVFKHISNFLRKLEIEDYIYCNLHIYKVINMNKKSPELSNKKKIPLTVIAK